MCQVGKQDPFVLFEIPLMEKKTLQNIDVLDVCLTGVLLNTVPFRILGPFPLLNCFHDYFSPLTHALPPPPCTDVRANLGGHANVSCLPRGAGAWKDGRMLKTIFWPHL